MPGTEFDPKKNGFAFSNSWRLSKTEMQRLHRRFNPQVQQATIFAQATFGLTGGLLISRGILRLREKIDRDLIQGFGLCGGMCFTALDIYKAGHQLRERVLDDRPSSASRLYTYIWKRQLQSLVDLEGMESDAARFMAWLIILNWVPAWPFRGGAAWLLARSREEWSELKAGIDADEPVPIGLVRKTENVFANHQVLAIGYDEADSDHGTIHLYDPNYPDEVSTIQLEFKKNELNGQENRRGSLPLRGFFCQAYEPADPAEALG